MERKTSDGITITIEPLGEASAWDWRIRATHPSVSTAPEDFIGGGLPIAEGVGRRCEMEIRRLLASRERKLAGAAQLRTSRERIADGTRWTQDQNARDASGFPRSAYEPDAVTFCAVGSQTRTAADLANAVEFAEQREEVYAADDVARAYLREAAMQMYHCSPQSVNDGRPGETREDAHRNILLVFDAAIAALEVDAQRAG